MKLMTLSYFYRAAKFYHRMLDVYPGYCVGDHKWHCYHKEDKFGNHVFSSVRVER